MPQWIVYDDTKLNFIGREPRDQVLYALTVGDLIGVYELKHGEDSWESLDAEVRVQYIRVAEKHLENAMGSWEFPLEAAIEMVDREHGH